LTRRPGQRLRNPLTQELFLHQLRLTIRPEVVLEIDHKLQEQNPPLEMMDMDQELHHIRLNIQLEWALGVAHHIFQVHLTNHHTLGQVEGHLEPSVITKNAEKMIKIGQNTFKNG